MMPKMTGNFKICLSFLGERCCVSVLVKSKFYASIFSRTKWEKLWENHCSGALVLQDGAPGRESEKEGPGQVRCGKGLMGSL